jgi:hypothetical protein
MTTRQPIGIASSTALFRSYLCGIIPVCFSLVIRKSQHLLIKRVNVREGTLAPRVHLLGSIKIIDPPTPIYQAITIHCPSRIPNITGNFADFLRPYYSLKGSLIDIHLGALSLPYQDGQPDLLVVVNYTTLGVSPNSIIDMRRSSITVRVGLDNDTGKFIHRTVPFTILPGTNLVSTLTLELRQLYKKPPLSAFGLFDVSFFEMHIAPLSGQEINALCIFTTY